jgi:Family of unknown function (DUF5681)
MDRCGYLYACGSGPKRGPELSPAKSEKKQGGRFQPGKSGNPNGRPAGSRNKATLAIDALLDGEAATLTRKAIALAKAGDMQALKLCMDRIVPPRRDRPVSFSLPKIEGPADAATAMGAVLEAAAAGELTPMEAGELAKLVDVYVRTVEANDFAKRLAELERKAGK